MFENGLLAAKLQSKLAIDAMVSALDVSVTVDDGKVTLTGTVDNYAQKERVESIVGSTAGVTEISNALIVGGANRQVLHHSQPVFGLVSNQECQRIEEKMKEALIHHSLVFPEDIRIHVYTSGTMELAGVVPNESVKRTLENLAWKWPKINHVANRLETIDEREQRTSKDEKDEGQSPLLSSLVAAAKLKAALVMDDTVKRPFNVSVEAQDPVLIIKGDVDNYAAKDIVMHYAKEIFTDSEITDQITVAENRDLGKLISEPSLTNIPIKGTAFDSNSNMAPIGYLPDTNRPVNLTDQARREAEKELEDAISVHPQFDAADVHCHVNHGGTAILVGQVKSGDDARNLEATAWQIRGIEHIVNGLEVA